MIGSLHVLEGARRAGTRKVVFASSGGTIYGDVRPADLPVTEAHPQRPMSPYGVAKKVVGDYLYAYRELHDLEYTALALANVYGPRQDPHGEAGVVAIFAGRLLAGEPCTIFGDGAPDPRLRVRRRRGRRLRPGRRQGQRPARQHRHRASRRRSTSCTRPWPGPPASTDPAVHAPARPGELEPLRPRPGQGRHPPRLEAVDRPRRGHRRRPRLVRRPARLTTRSARLTTRSARLTTRSARLTTRSARLTTRSEGRADGCGEAEPSVRQVGGRGAGDQSSLAMTAKPRPQKPPMRALVGERNDTTTYSSGSGTSSPRTSTVAVAVISPGWKVTVPEAGT